MNFALPAILFFLIVLPGFLFRSRLKRAEQTSFDYSPFGRVVTEALLWAMGLHALWLVVVWLSGRTVHPATLLGLLSSAPDLQRQAVDDVTVSFFPICAYFASLYAFSFAVPVTVRKTISHWRLDRSGARFAPIFRFHDAPWYYLLTGADFAAGEEPDWISIAAVIQIAGAPVLYVGILADFYFDADGQLDRLVLENVARRPLGRDKSDFDESDLDRFYPIDGDYFVIRYREVLTLNVHYVKFEHAGYEDVRDVGDTNTVAIS